MKKNVFDYYMNKLLELPLWVKQVIYVKLKEDMQKNGCAEFLDKSSDEMFSLYEPILTFEGKNELLQRGVGLDLNIYNFLKLCDKNYSILEISLNMFLTMEEVAKYFMFCVEQKFLEKPISDEIYAMAGFIAGKFKTGEYFEQNKTLTSSQVQEVLAEQKKLNSQCEKSLKYAEVLSKMNLLENDDCNVVFYLKEEAKKRFILDYNVVPDSVRTFKTDDEKLQAEFENLQDENRNLKRKLSQLLQLVKRDV